MLSCHTQQEIADAVGVDRTVVTRRTEELCDLDKCPKSTKVTATYAEAEADWKPPLYTVWAFSKSSNDIEHAGQSEWWMGEMLAVKDPAYKAGSGRGKKGGSATLPPFTPPSLDDLSISKRESAEAQRLAKLPKNPGGKGTPKNCLSKEKELEAHEKAARLTGASPADGGLLIAVTWRYRNGWDGSGEGNTNQRRRRSVGW